MGPYGHDERECDFARENGKVSAFFISFVFFFVCVCEFGKINRLEVIKISRRQKWEKTFFWICVKFATLIKFRFNAAALCFVCMKLHCWVEQNDKIDVTFQLVYNSSKGPLNVKLQIFFSKQWHNGILVFFQCILVIFFLFPYLFQWAIVLPFKQIVLYEDIFLLLNNPSS